MVKAAAVVLNMVRRSHLCQASPSRVPPPQDLLPLEELLGGITLLPLEAVAHKTSKVHRCLNLFSSKLLRITWFLSYWPPPVRKSATHCSHETYLHCHHQLKCSDLWLPGPGQGWGGSAPGRLGWCSTVGRCCLCLEKHRVCSQPLQPHWMSAGSSPPPAWTRGMRINALPKIQMFQVLFYQTVRCGK